MSYSDPRLTGFTTKKHPKHHLYMVAMAIATSYRCIHVHLDLGLEHNRSVALLFRSVIGSLYMQLIDPPLPPL
jgi:hypothetical protein